MKKIFITMVMLVSVCMLCAGCGGQEETTEVSTNDFAESTESEVYSRSLPSTGEPATDYEIIGGSSNVVDISSDGKVYSVICPYCGYYIYDIESSDLMLDTPNHYSGEVTTETKEFICPSGYYEGCGRDSTFGIKVRWK